MEIVTLKYLRNLQKIFSNDSFDRFLQLNKSSRFGKRCFFAHSTSVSVQIEENARFFCRQNFDARKREDPASRMFEPIVLEICCQDGVSVAVASSDQGLSAAFKLSLKI
jgi:hypothetical protein